jgi:threonine dehydratase
VRITEEEIDRALQVLCHEDRMVAEGACVVGLAACLSGKVVPRRPVGTIVTGRNADMGLFTRVVTGKDVMPGEYKAEGRPHAA